MRQTLADAATRLQERAVAAGTWCAPTVSEVCREADVARPTFYQYFDSVDALLATVYSARLSEGLDSPTVSAPGPDDPARTADRLLEVLSRDELLRQAVTQSGAETRRAAITSITEHLIQRHRLDPADPASALKARYAAAGVIEVIAAWFDTNDHTITGDSIVDIATTLTRTLMNQPQADHPYC